MKLVEETMTIIHLKNNHRKINILEEIEMLKAASSQNLLNDPVFRLPPSVSAWNSTDERRKKNFNNQVALLMMLLS